MGRFNLNVRPVYDPNEPTFGEQLSRGIQGGLDYYAGRRERARQEGNTVGAAGGVRQPDRGQPGIKGRLRGIGSAIGNIIHGSPPELPHPQIGPTGTFAPGTLAPGYGTADPSRYPMDERIPGEEALETMPDADDMVSGAMLGRVVRPSPPIDALPLSARPALNPALGGGPSIGVNNGLPTLLAASPERTFEYEGEDGSRYRMPQTGERARTQRMEEQEATLGLKDRYQQKDQEDQIAALVAAGMPPAEARARVLNNVVRYDEEFGQRRPATLTYEERSKLAAEHDARIEAMRVRLARLTGAGRGNSPEALAIRRMIAETGAKREERLGEQRGDANIKASGQLEATTAATEQRGAVINPRDRRRLERDPAAKAANDARIARADSAVSRAQSSAEQLRTRAVPATKPPSNPNLQNARVEEARLKRRGLSTEQARAAMRAAGWPIK